MPTRAHGPDVEHWPGPHWPFLCRLREDAARVPVIQIEDMNFAIAVDQCIEVAETAFMRREIEQPLFLCPGPAIVAGVSGEHGLTPAQGSDRKSQEAAVRKRNRLYHVV